MNVFWRGKVMKHTHSVRVLSVMNPFRPAYSGEGEAWLRMVPFLAQRGVDVEILTSGNAACEETFHTEVIEGVLTHRVNVQSRAPWSRMMGVIGALIKQRGQFDVALFHGPNYDSAYASCVLGHVLGWKTVYKITLYDSDDFLTIRNTGRLGRVRLAALRLADGFVCMSEFLRKTMDQTEVKARRFLVAANAMDMSRFRPADDGRRKSARRKLNVPEGAKVVLFCGGLIHRKGVDILVEAWRTVTECVENATLLLVGPNHHDDLEEPDDREFSARIERRIAEAGLRQSIRLEGYRKEMETYYAAADVFVLPSRAEGWPSVVNEAMASGLPCVVSWLEGSSEEYLRDGDDGIIVRSEAAVEYAAQIVRLLANRRFARRIGKSARKRAAELFDVETVSDRYAAFLLDACGRCPPERVEPSRQGAVTQRGLDAAASDRLMET